MKEQEQTTNKQKEPKSTAPSAENAGGIKETKRRSWMTLVVDGLAQIHVVLLYLAATVLLVWELWDFVGKKITGGE